MTSLDWVYFSQNGFQRRAFESFAVDFIEILRECSDIFSPFTLKKQEPDFQYLKWLGACPESSLRLVERRVSNENEEKVCSMIIGHFMVAIFKAYPLLHNSVCTTRERKCLISRFSHIKLIEKRWRPWKGLCWLACTQNFKTINFDKPQASSADYGSFINMLIKIHQVCPIMISSIIVTLTLINPDYFVFDHLIRWLSFFYCCV